MFDRFHTPVALQPNDINSHPHLSMDGKIAVVHNGIIENFVALRKALEAKG